MDKEKFTEMLRIRCGKGFRKQVKQAAKEKHWTEAQFVRDVLIKATQPAGK
jgi:hypothetical protein